MTNGKGRALWRWWCCKKDDSRFIRSSLSYVCVLQNRSFTLILARIMPRWWERACSFRFAFSEVLCGAKKRCSHSRGFITSRYCISDASRWALGNLPTKGDFAYCHYLTDYVVLLYHLIMFSKYDVPNIVLEHEKGREAWSNFRNSENPIFLQIFQHSKSLVIQWKIR